MLNLKIKSKPAAPADISKLRAEIGLLQAERTKTASAPPAREDLLARLDDAISMRAAEYAARIDGLAPDEKLEVALREYAPSADGLAPLRTACLFSPDQVRETYIELIDKAVTEHPPGLPAGERKAALAGLDAKLGEAEGAEETAIAGAEDRGAPVARRPDFRPEIFFETHGRADGLERLADMALAAETAHAAMLSTIDALRKIKSKRARLIARIEGQDVDRFVGRDDDGNPLYENLWRERHDAIVEQFLPDLRRFDAAVAATKSAWEPVAATVRALRDHAETEGITTGGTVDWQGGRAA